MYWGQETKNAIYLAVEHKVDMMDMPEVVKRIEYLIEVDLHPDVYARAYKDQKINQAIDYGEGRYKG